VDLDAGQAGKCWLRFHYIILTEWCAAITRPFQRR
jgi:hypothetical protein